MENQTTNEEVPQKDTGLNPGGYNPDAAQIAALLGKDTRQSYGLKGIDGKPLKIPPMEVTLHMIYLELQIMRIQRAK